jgi:HlyD family secretion protein
MPDFSAIFSKLWRHKWLWMALVLALLTAVAGVRWWLGPQVQGETVSRRDVLQTVVASGHLQTPRRVDIGAQITGTVARVPVTDGQNVQAGQVLIDLAADDLQAVARQTAQAVAQAQGRLRQLQTLHNPVAQQALRQAQVQADHAQATLARQNELFEQGFIGQAALDEARKALALARAQAETARQQLASVSASGSDTLLAQGAVAEAQAAAQAAQAKAAYARISAPVAGQLIGRHVEVGDVVQPGKVLMTLSPEGRTQLVVQVDEKNLHLIALGQPALASADAYPQQRFKAVVAYINPGVNAQTGAVEVRLDVPETVAYLQQDMTVSVDIEVARRSLALTVPTGVVHDLQSTAPWVWRVAASHAERRTLRLGLRGGAWVEVLDGLAEGDQVLQPLVGVRAGQRVRVVSPASSASGG